MKKIIVFVAFLSFFLPITQTKAYKKTFEPEKLIIGVWHFIKIETTYNMSRNSKSEYDKTVDNILKNSIIVFYSDSTYSKVFENQEIEGTYSFSSDHTIINMVENKSRKRQKFRIKEINQNKLELITENGVDISKYTLAKNLKPGFK